MTASSAAKKRSKRKADDTKTKKSSKHAKHEDNKPSTGSDEAQVGHDCAGAALSEKYAYPFEVLFCEHCGTLFDLSSTGTLMNCQMCGHETRLGELQSDKKESGKKAKKATRLIYEHTTEIELGAKKEWMDPDHFVVRKVKQRAEVDEECPQCQNPKMLFWTRQLRSADEGQTVFYECPACEHRFSTNT